MSLREIIKVVNIANRKTDKAAAFGAALGASIGSGRKWTMADSMRLGASINALDSMKEDTSSSYSYYGSSHEYDDEKMEAIEDAGLDPFDFDMY